MATDQEALLLQYGVQLASLQKQMDQAVGVVSDGGARMVLKSKAAMAEVEKAYGSVDAKGFTDTLKKTAALQDQLAAAQAAKNTAVAKGLREQLILQQAVQRAQTAQLETQLAIARATGAKGQVAQLTEALAVQSQLTKLQSVGLTGTKGLVEAEAAVKALAAAEKVAEKEGIALAATRVFDSAKFGVLEEGSAKLRVFGSALEPLGAIGITAAAGVVAFALAMEKTEKAVEVAANIAKLSKEVGVSTDFIQKFNFALKQNEIDVASGDEALKKMNITLGAVKAGLAKKQQVNAFASVGFTPEQLRTYKDIGELFPVLAERIAKVGDAAEQAAIAKRLGGEELLALLKDGENGFSVLAQKATDLGIVIDHYTIEKAEDAKKKLSELNDVMQAKTNVTFLQFIDTLAAVKTAFLEATTAALQFLAAVTGTETAKIKLTEAEGAAKNPLYRLLYGDKRLQGDLKTAQLAEGIYEKIIAPPTPGEGGKPAKQLVPGTPKHGPSDQTAEFDKAANDIYESALKALIEAQKALTGDIEERAKFERDAIAADLAKKTNDQKTGSLDEEEKKIAEAVKKKADAHSREQLALIEKAKTEEKATANAKIDLVNRQADFAKEDQLDDTRKQLVDATIAQLSAAAAQATTAAERTQIERDILKLKQDELIHETGKALSRAVQTGAISQDVADQRNQAALDNRAAERTQFDVAHETPVQRYLRSLQDFDTEVQTAGVQALESLSNGLADAIVNAHSLGDVAKNVFRQMVADLLAASIRKDIEAPLLHVFGFASGGSVHGPGTGASDSIPAMLSAGEFVVKADAAGKHRALLEAINSGRVPHLAQGGFVTPTLPTFQTINALASMRVPQGLGGVTVVQPLHFHAEGAVVTDELLAQANDHANRAAIQAGQWARSAARQDNARASYAGNLNA